MKINHYLYCSCLLFVSALCAANGKVTTSIQEHFRYDMIVVGKDVGDIRVDIERQTDGRYLFLQQSHIQTGGWWGTVNIRSHYYEAYDSDGKLQSIDSKLFDGDSAWWTQIQRAEGQLWAFNTEITDLSNTEERQLLTLANNLNAQSTLSIGKLISTSQQLFTGRKQPSKQVSLDSKAFVSSFDNLPFYWASRGQKLPSRIRLLDSEKLISVDYRVEQIKQHYRLYAENAKPISLWFAISPRGTAHLVRMQGEDEDGAFVIQLKLSTGK